MSHEEKEQHKEPDFPRSKDDNRDKDLNNDHRKGTESTGPREPAEKRHKG